eukprot:PhF_6_TR6808/c0_g1_i1/m.9799
MSNQQDRHPFVSKSFRVLLRDHKSKRERWRVRDLMFEEKKLICFKPSHGRGTALREVYYIDTFWNQITFDVFDIVQPVVCENGSKLVLEGPVGLLFYTAPNRIQLATAQREEMLLHLGITPPPVVYLSPRGGEKFFDQQDEIAQPEQPVQRIPQPTINPTPYPPNLPLSDLMVSPPRRISPRRPDRVTSIPLYDLHLHGGAPVPMRHPSSDAIVLNRSLPVEWSNTPNSPLPPQPRPLMSREGYVPNPGPIPGLKSFAS